MFASLREKKCEKLRVIDRVLSDLEQLRSTTTGDAQYALEQNIAFFRAVRRPRSYLEWLIAEASNIDGSRLLELSDFGNPEWQARLQAELVSLEERSRPDILRRVRETIVEKLQSFSKETVILCGVGAGALELERQVIEVLKRKKQGPRFLFCVVDNSQSSLDMGFRRLGRLGIPVRQVQRLDKNSLDTISREAAYPYEVVAYCGDVFMLEEFAGKNPLFDLVYYSKFKHHLSPATKPKFIRLVTRISRLVIEADDYQGLYLPFFSVLTAWYQPVLLNGAVFSSFRDPTLNELRSEKDPRWETKIWRGSGYVKVYSGV